MAGLLLYKKLAELQAYECSTPSQEIGVKNRRWEERKRNEKRIFRRTEFGKRSH